MDTQSEPDEQHQALMDNRHLQETIGALRTEMEEMRIDKEVSVQKAIAAANDDMTQLKNTITALRTGMERQGYTGDEAVQKAIADANQEIVQLRGTIGALREELENMRFDKDEAVQKAVAVANNEIVQLRSTITTLRDELEKMRFDKNEAVQKALADANMEITQVKATAGALRDQLEKLRFDMDEAVQKAVADANQEVIQLRSTIGALRDELERNKILHDEKVQDLERGGGATKRPTCAEPSRRCATIWRPPRAPLRAGGKRRDQGRKRGRAMASKLSDRTKASRRRRPADPAKALSQAEMLLEISQRVAAIESLDEVLSTLVEITTAQTECERSTLFLNDEETSELYSRVAQGNFKREIRILNDSGIAGHVYQSGEGVIIHDAYKDSRFNRDVDEQTGFVTKGILCAPVRTAKGEVIGVAQALNKRHGRFTKDDLALLEAMTTQAAVALQSAQFVERMTKLRKREVEFLDVVSDLTSEIDLTTLLQKVMGEATRMLKADRSTLFLHDEKKGELWSQVGEGLGATQIRLPNTAGIAGHVFTSGQTVNIPYAYADLRFNPAFDKKTGYFTRSILCVPVINKDGKTIGVTQVLNRIGGPFTDEDEARLKAFTAQIAIGLENAKLFDDVQNMKNYNESMLESMSNGVITMNEEGKIVTCNLAGMRILQVAAEDILERQAENFFSGATAWVMDKVKKVEESGEADIMMGRRAEGRRRDPVGEPECASPDQRRGGEARLHDHDRRHQHREAQ